MLRVFSISLDYRISLLCVSIFLYKKLTTCEFSSKSEEYEVKKNYTKRKFVSHFLKSENIKTLKSKMY
jgi:hypothetical protein